jgi:hypothetical protein
MNPWLCCGVALLVRTLYFNTQGRLNVYHTFEYRSSHFRKLIGALDSPPRHPPSGGYRARWLGAFRRADGGSGPDGPPGLSALPNRKNAADRRIPSTAK